MHTEEQFTTGGTPEPHAAKASLDNSARPRRILVVEDDDAIRRLNVEVLFQSGYQVDAAPDGAAGWEALQLNEYDLVVTDNNMPKVTGLDLIKRLHDFNPHVPAIMATGNPPNLDFAKEYEIKPEILFKPYTTENLLKAVKKVLANN